MNWISRTEVSGAEWVLGMSDSKEQRNYLSAEELSALTGLSLSTIRRLKDAGKIPFFQPAGKCGRLLFPADAMEQAAQAPKPQGAPIADAERPTRLSGRQPKWTQSPP
jgi:excisionase family DNA binding protein